MKHAAAFLLIMLFAGAMFSMHVSEQELIEWVKGDATTDKNDDVVEYQPQKIIIMGDAHDCETFMHAVTEGYVVKPFRQLNGLSIYRLTKKDDGAITFVWQIAADWLSTMKPDLPNYRAFLKFHLNGWVKESIGALFIFNASTSDPQARLALWQEIALNAQKMLKIVAIKNTRDEKVKETNFPMPLYYFCDPQSSVYFLQVFKKH